MTTWTLQLSTIANSTTLSYSWLKDGLTFGGNPDAEVGDSLTVTFEPPVWDQATTVALNLSWAPSLNSNPPMIAFNGTGWNGLCRWDAFVIPPVGSGPAETYIFRAVIAHFPSSGPTDVSYYDVDPTMVVRGGGGPLELE